MADVGDDELRRTAHELQDWLEAKRLTPRQAIVVQTMALSEFIGYCSNDRAGMERTLDVVIEDLRSASGAFMAQKERGRN